MNSLSGLSSYISDFLTCKTVESVWAKHVTKMAEYGFDRLIFGSTRFRTHGNFGDVTDALVLTNHDHNYLELFFGREMYLYAPMAIWAADNVGVSSWQRAQDRKDEGLLSDKEIKLLELNAKMNVVAGYSVSFEEKSQRSKAAIGLCAAPGINQKELDAMWASKGEEIIMLNSLLDLKVATLPNFGTRKPMTKRQKEVLQWVADGKTLQDISVIMGLSSATVEKHLRLARENLNVDTTAQAVLKASIQNQFYLFEDVGQIGKSVRTEKNVFWQ